MSHEYKKCSCGGDCYLYDNDDEQKIRPCWGDVDPIDEIDWGDELGWSWVHSCEGHWEQYQGSVNKYNPKPREQENDNI